MDKLDDDDDQYQLLDNKGGGGGLGDLETESCCYMSEMLYPTVDEGEDVDDTTDEDLKYI